MAKKKKIDLGKILSAAAILLSVAALAMAFLPSIVSKNISGFETGITYSGWNVAFGYKDGSLAVLNFSIGNFLAYLFILVGAALCVLPLLGKGGKMVSFIAGGILVAAGVLCFLALVMCVPASTRLSQSFKDSFTLGVGSILSGVMSLLAGLTMIAKSLLSK